MRDEWYCLTGEKLNLQGIITKVKRIRQNKLFNNKFLLFNLKVEVRGVDT